jgi:hypothetical protein
MPVKKSVGWKEIDEVVAECEANSENTSFPERTYEDGVKAGIQWVTGLGDSHPMEKEE